MVRAAMPKAAVDEDGHAVSGEGDVDPPPRQPGHGVLDTEPSTPTVQLAP